MVPFFTAPWPIKGLAVTSDSVVVAGEQLLVVDRHTQAVRAELSSPCQDVDIHPDGELFALTLQGGHVAVGRVDSGEIVSDANDYRYRRGSWLQFNRVRFSPSGRFLASDCGDALVVWNCDDLTVAYRYDDKHEVTALDWLPDESGVVFGTKHHFGIFRFETQNEPVTKRSGSVGDVCVLGNSGRIAVGSGSGQNGILIVDSSLETKIVLEQRHVTRLRHSPDAESLYAGSYPAHATGLWCWDLRRRRGACIEDHGETIHAIAVDGTSGELFCAGTDCQVTQRV